jgi:hypothetical protein
LWVIVMVPEKDGAEGVGDFLYDWQDTGEAPTKAAARLLDLVCAVEFLDQAMGELHGRLNNRAECDAQCKRGAGVCVHHGSGVCNA